VRLPRKFVDEMVAHCEAGRPNEACGVLATNNGEVVKVVAMENAARSATRYRFDIDEQFAMHKALSQRGWELGGVFHSHPQTAPYPSQTDVREAHEDVPYIIISLASQPPEIRAFRIVKENWFDEQGEIQEVPVVVEG
jgi:proteasome lid subunit RPN8/RPN11